MLSLEYVKGAMLSLKPYLISKYNVSDFYFFGDEALYSISFASAEATALRPKSSTSPKRELYILHRFVKIH